MRAISESQQHIPSNYCNNFARSALLYYHLIFISDFKAFKTSQHSTLNLISNRFPCYLYHKGDIDLPDIRPVKSASPENVAFIGDIVIRKILYISAFYTCLCYATQQLNHILMWWKLLHRVQLSQNVLSIFISGVICKNPCFLKTPCQITVTFFKESKQSLYILDNSR